MPARPEKQRANRWGPLQPLGEAIRFLTMFPVPGLPPMKEATVARAMVAFPLVGFLIGACGLGAGLLAGWLFGEPVRAAVVVVTWMVVTWGLHLDGLADSADALFSWRPRERKLEIMKDSRIGTMGSLALISTVLLKVVALYSLGPAWWAGALLAPMWGRWSDIYGIFFFPAAREGGMGRNFHDQVRLRDFVFATAGAVLVGGVLLPPWGALAGLGVLATAHLLARWMVRVLGGLTGDTYGALSEVGEIVTLLALAALAHHAVLS
ncbi:MAG: adenosylcobinamide-GDP ribazoletransferase [Rubrobacteraceae bacterium]